MAERLIPAKVYLTLQELDELRELARDEGQTVSAVIRAKLGLPFIRRDAPDGNTNRRKTKTQTKTVEPATSYPVSSSHPKGAMVTRVASRESGSLISLYSKALTAYDGVWE